MFLTHMAALAVSAFKTALERPGHPVLGGKDLWVGSEFPAVEANYPGVWVTFDSDARLRRAGISHVEQTVPDAQGNRRQVTRWMFSGTVSATVVAMSARERDELVDEIIRLLAFSAEHPETAHLKAAFEQNDYIAVNVAFDDFRITGMSDNGRTPWGSEEAVHEGTIALTVQGEFLSDLTSQYVLVPISEIVIIDEIDESGLAEPGGVWQ